VCISFESGNNYTNELFKYRTLNKPNMVVDTVIENGTVVNPDEVITGGVAIDDGSIVAVGSNSSLPEAEEIIDVDGKMILPRGS